MKISKYQKFNEAEEPVLQPEQPGYNERLRRAIADARARKLKKLKKDKEKIEKPADPYAAVKGLIPILNNSADFKKLGVKMTQCSYKDYDQHLRHMFSEVYSLPSSCAVFKLDVSGKKFDFAYEKLEVGIAILKAESKNYCVYLFDNARYLQQYKIKKDNVGEKSLLNTIMGMIVKYDSFRTETSKKLVFLKSKYDKVIGNEAIVDNFSGLFDMCDSYQVEPIVFPSTVKIKLTFVSSQFKLNSLYYKKINKKYVSIFEELMTISERLADEGASLYYHQIPTGIHIILKLDEINDLLKIKKKKIEAGYITPPEEPVEESVFSKFLNRKEDLRKKFSGARSEPLDVSSSNHSTIKSDILSLTSSPEFQKEKITIESPREDNKFLIIYGKKYTDYRMRTGGKVRRPVSISLTSSGVGSGKFNISYNYQSGRYLDVLPQINKNGILEDEVKNEIKNGIMYVCGLSNAYELKAKKAAKASESRKKSIERQKSKFEGQITRQFVLDEFANVFDLCQTYSVREPLYSSKYKSHIVNVIFRSNLVVSRFSRQNCTKVDVNFVDFYSELMTTSERLADQGIDMDLISKDNGVDFEAVISMKKKEKSKKSETPKEV